MKEILLFFVVLGWGLMIGVLANDACPGPVGFVCDSNQMNNYRFSLDLKHRQFESQYDNRASINRAELDSVIEQYRRDLNEVRACQKSLGQRPTACDLKLHSKNPLGEKYFLREVVVSIFERNGECIRGEDLRIQEITNDTGSFFASGINGKWMFQDEVSPTCHANGATGAPTTRSFSLRGYEEGHSASKAYFQVIDWAESETDAFKVSQNWAKQIQMGERTTLAIRAEDRVLKFEFSNGAYLSIDGYSNTVVDSNFLSLDHFTSSQCQTDEIQIGSGSIEKRARFSPKLRFSAPYHKLPVRTLKQ